MKRQLFHGVVDDGLGPYTHASAAIVSKNKIMLLVRDIGISEDSSGALTSQLIHFSDPMDAIKWMAENTQMSWEELLGKKPRQPRVKRTQDEPLARKTRKKRTTKGAKS